MRSQSWSINSLSCKGGVQDDCAITPVISESSANFIEGLVKDAEKKGATLCQEYKRENNLIWPVLIDHVTAVCTSPVCLVCPPLSLRFLQVLYESCLLHYCPHRLHLHRIHSWVCACGFALWMHSQRLQIKLPLHFALGGLSTGCIPCFGGFLFSVLLQSLQHLCTAYLLECGL